MKLAIKTHVLHCPWISISCLAKSDPTTWGAEIIKLEGLEVAQK